MLPFTIAPPAKIQPPLTGSISTVVVEHHVEKNHYLELARCETSSERTHFNTSTFTLNPSPKRPQPTLLIPPLRCQPFQRKLLLAVLRIERHHRDLGILSGFIQMWNTSRNLVRQTRLRTRQIGSFTDFCRSKNARTWLLLEPGHQHALHSLQETMENRVWTSMD